MKDDQREAYVYFPANCDVNPDSTINLAYYHNWAVQSAWQAIHKYGEVQMYTQWRVREVGCLCTYVYGNQNIPSTQFDQDLGRLSILVSNIAGIDIQYYPAILICIMTINLT